MELRRIEETPIFVSTIDEYTLAQFKTEEGKLVAQMHSKLENGVKWNTDRIVDLINAGVGTREHLLQMSEDLKPLKLEAENRAKSLSMRSAILLAIVGGGGVQIAWELIKFLFSSHSVLPGK